MIFTAGDHELKVIVHVESVKGEASAQEREMEPPSCDDSRGTRLQSRWMIQPSSRQAGGATDS